MSGVGIAIWVRVWVGLLFFFGGIIHGRAVYRGLRGLVLTGRRAWLGYGLSASMVAVGLGLSITSRLRVVTLAAIPAVVAAMLLLALVSSWANRDLTPPDARFPGRDDPWKAQEVAFQDGEVSVPALLLVPVRPNGGAVCWVHGTGDGRAQYKWRLARALARRGLAVLTFDLPGHGDHPASFSLPQALSAVPAAVSYLMSHPLVDEKRVGVMGVSLGGALAIRALSCLPPESFPRALCLLQTPCSLWLGGWLILREVLGAAALKSLQVFCDTSVANLLRLYRTHPRPRFAQPLEWILDDLAPSTYIAASATPPLLLVGGSRDPIAPPRHIRRLYHRADQPKQMHIVRGASHVSLIFVEQTAELVGEWFAEQLGMERRATTELVGRVDAGRP